MGEKVFVFVFQAIAFWSSGLERGKHRDLQSLFGYAYTIYMGGDYEHCAVTHHLLSQSTRPPTQPNGYNLILYTTGDGELAQAKTTKCPGDTPVAEARQTMPRVSIVSELYYQLVSR